MGRGMLAELGSVHHLIGIRTSGHWSRDYPALGAAEMHYFSLHRLLQSPKEKQTNWISQPLPPRGSKDVQTSRRENTKTYHLPCI